MKPWYYFGCGNGPGHYLFGEGMRSITRSMIDGDRALEKLDRGAFDGLLAPRVAPVKLYHAVYSTLPGLGFVAVSWHDQSEDKRSGSNSIIFAPIERDTGMPEYEDVLRIGREKFPRVFSRLPQELTRWEQAF